MSLVEAVKDLFSVDLESEIASLESRIETLSKRRNAAQADVDQKREAHETARLDFGAKPGEATKRAKRETAAALEDAQDILAAREKDVAAAQAKLAEVFAAQEKLVLAREKVRRAEERAELQRISSLAVFRAATNIPFANLLEAIAAVRAHAGEIDAALRAANDAAAKLRAEGLEIADIDPIHVIAPLLLALGVVPTETGLSAARKEATPDDGVSALGYSTGLPHRGGIERAVLSGLEYLEGLPKATNFPEARREEIEAMLTFRSRAEYQAAVEAQRAKEEDERAAAAKEEAEARAAEARRVHEEMTGLAYVPREPVATNGVQSTGYFADGDWPVSH